MIKLTHTPISADDPMFKEPPMSNAPKPRATSKRPKKLTQKEKAKLEALAKFLRVFDAPGFQAGASRPLKHIENGVITIPCSDYSRSVEDFVEMAYQTGWVLDNFNWSTWAQTAEARALRDNPVILAKATSWLLAKLVTTVIRQDRYVEGALSAAFESGLILNIVRRAARILTEQPSEK